VTEDQPSLGEIARSLHRIEEQLSKGFDDHEGRIRKVERWMYAVPPTIVLAVASVIAAVRGAT
jgi:hypothetical protein